jgi:hypothetical protein
MARRSRFTDRPMSPYESALSDALFVAFPALVRLGADQEELRRELREQAYFVSFFRAGVERFFL